MNKVTSVSLCRISIVFKLQQAARFHTYVIKSVYFLLKHAVQAILCVIVCLQWVKNSPFCGIKSQILPHCSLLEKLCSALFMQTHISYVCPQGQTAKEHVQRNQKRRHAGYESETAVTFKLIPLALQLTISLRAQTSKVTSWNSMGTNIQSV